MKTVRLTTAQALCRYLSVQWSEREGVRRRVVPALMGIFGHGNACGVGQALAEPGVDLAFYQPRNEQAMVHTAIGYAKACDRLASLACTASIGPGSTNMLTGAATATVNRVPVLLLPSDTFASRRQGPVLQQLEFPAAGDVSVNDCFRPVSRYFDRIARPEQLLTALPEAIRVLLDPAETGAVTLALHQDVQGEAADFPASFFEPRTWKVARRPPAHEEIAVAAALLGSATRPLVVAGGGVRYSGAGGELAALAERLGMPVAETSAGKGACPPGDLHLGGIGVNGTRAANAVARDADLVVCVGTRLTDFTTGSHSLFQHADVRFLAINVCAADAGKLGAAPVVADAKLALIELAHALDPAWSTDASYAAEVVARRRQWEDELEADLAPRTAERMSQGQLLRGLNDHVREGDVVVAAAGFLPGDVLKQWTCRAGETCALEFGYSCMGHEIPSALGFRLALPAAGEVYALVGDGSYLMANTELVTAVEEGLKLTVVVVENGGYQSIRALQVATTGTALGTEFAPCVDYAANAASLGCAVFEAETPKAFAASLEAARAERRVSVVVARAEPRRPLLSSGSWWDLGVAQVSTSPAVAELEAAHARGRELQRFYG